MHRVRPAQGVLPSEPACVCGDLSREFDGAQGTAQVVPLLLRVPQLGAREALGAAGSSKRRRHLGQSKATSSATSQRVARMSLPCSSTTSFTSALLSR